MCVESHRGHFSDCSCCCSGRDLLSAAAAAATGVAHEISSPKVRECSSDPELFSWPTTMLCNEIFHQETKITVNMAQDRCRGLKNLLLFGIPERSYRKTQFYDGSTKHVSKENNIHDLI